MNKQTCESPETSNCTGAKPRGTGRPARRVLGRASWVSMNFTYTRSCNFTPGICRTLRSPEESPASGISNVGSSCPGAGLRDAPRRGTVRLRNYPHTASFTGFFL